VLARGDNPPKPPAVLARMTAGTAGQGQPAAGPEENTGGPAENSADPAGGEPGDPAAASSGGEDELPLRVSTLEIFFDLVFAFTLTQLTAVLASRLSWLAVAQVLLTFGLLWWMYGAYAWLTNNRPPVHTGERLALLVGMAGFLVVGLAIPRGFSSYGLVLGLGYLVVVLVHTWMFYQVNTDILRVAPFNIGSAVLVTIAGLLHDSSGATSGAGYALWLLALLVQLGSPVIVRPSSHFEIRARHYTERHNGLVIIAIGVSVAAIGIGAAGPVSHERSVHWQLLAGALLGLALAAALWWIAFGSGDEERAARMLIEAPSQRRTALILQALFYGNIPLLLGLVAVASGVVRAVTEAAATTPGAGPGVPAGQAGLLAAGAALFLAGDAIVLRLLRLGPVRWRAAAAALALATTAVGVAAGLDVQLVVVIAVLVLPLIAERPPAGRTGAPGSGAG
jgi:low temperature requirement protein LtrA